MCLRNFFRKFVNSRAEPEPLSRLKIYLQKSEVINNADLLQLMRATHHINVSAIGRGPSFRPKPPQVLPHQAAPPHCLQCARAAPPLGGSSSRAWFSHDGGDEESQNAHNTTPHTTHGATAFFNPQAAGQVVVRQYTRPLPGGPTHTTLVMPTY